MMKKRDGIFIAFIVLLAIGLFIYFDRVQILEFAREQKRETLPPAIGYQEKQEVDTKIPSTPSTPVATKPVQPISPSVKGVEGINLFVPFTSQAPTGDWNQPFQDACEEASVLMVKEYYAKSTARVIDSSVATNALLEMVAFEDKTLGYFLDTTVSETASFAEKLYGFAKSEIISDPTIDQLKERLNKGEPIIVPAAGQLLKNPYFTAPGPVYHMLVIRGYTKDNKFIVNDPGTKHGEAYLYSFETMMNAMHDWDAKDMLNGKKVVLILHPKK